MGVNPGSQRRIIMQPLCVIIHNSRQTVFLFLFTKTFTSVCPTEDSSPCQTSTRSHHLVSLMKVQALKQRSYNHFLLRLVLTIRPTYPCSGNSVCYSVVSLKQTEEHERRQPLSPFSVSHYCSIYEQKIQECGATDIYL